MAQPLYNNVPPFCLACLGTDNKFNDTNAYKCLMQRWKTEGDKRNIAVLSFGGDGDSQVMRCMKVSTTLFTPPCECEPFSSYVPLTTLYSVKSVVIPKLWTDWFYVTDSMTSFVQDIVHVAVKLKSRLEYIMLLKLPIILSSNSFIFHLLFSKLFPG